MPHTAVDRRPAPVTRIPGGAAFRETGPDGEERWRPGAPFLRNAWYLAGFVQEFVQGLLARTILEEPIVFFRAADGTIAALEDRCPHVGAPLSLGSLKGGQVECGYHGMMFDGSGRCTAIPGQDKIPPQACVYRYPLVQRFEEEGRTQLPRRETRRHSHAYIGSRYYSRRRYFGCGSCVR